ncbi:MAG: PepSY-associated TM helix domain-containing protein [Polyangiaceae bacterium]
MLALHRWCGLFLSLNMLVFCLTGMVLIFRDEIDAALGVVPQASHGSTQISLATAVASARKHSPSANPVYVARFDDHPGIVFVGMAQGHRKLEGSTPLAVDSQTGKVLGTPDFENSFTGVVFHLHAELLAGPVGRLLVGAIGLALLVTLVTGAVVYGPLMKRFTFGLLRRGRHRRVLFADLHKLLGAASFGWTLTVTVTGILLSLASTLLQVYAMTELAALAAPYAKEAPIEDVSTLDAAVRNAEQRSGRQAGTVLLPGSDLSSPRHYAVLLTGNQGLDKRVFTMGLVDAKDPSVFTEKQLPWYLRMILVSEPLHFGDYGGYPLKLLWVVFSCATTFMAGSGVYMFWVTRRHHASRDRVQPLDTEAAEVGAE